jgi:alkanesulfonate monooxygenase SsuD/methylene tetrahydromethanopterin reductase-like flavin-dependent oxidoreductase (luciferase family)
MKHYEMTSPDFGTKKSHEFYSNVGKFISEHGTDAAARRFAMLMPWGTPDQVIEKIAFIRDTIDANGIMLSFSFGGMPYEDAERSIKCFAKIRDAGS